jgi:hypothetical protein
MRFDSLGTVVEIRISDPSLGALIRALFEVFPRTEQRAELVLTVLREGDRYSILAGEETVMSKKTRSGTLVRLLSIVNRATVYGWRGLVIHAGAVAGGGQVIAFPGKANSGKSTLVAACLTAGLDYVSDEGLAVSPLELEIAVYPKALWLTRDSRAAVGLSDEDLLAPLPDRYKSPVLADELDAKIADDSLPLRHVVIHERNGQSVALEPLGSAEGAERILRHAFNRYDEPRRWFLTTASLARGFKTWRLEYDDALEAVKLLKERLLA